MQDSDLPLDQDSFLTSFFAPENLQNLFEQASHFLVSHLVNWGTGLQLAIILGAIVPAAIFSPSVKRLCSELVEKKLEPGILRRFASALTRLALPIAIYLVLSLAMMALSALEQKTDFLRIARSLLIAWIVIRAVTLAIRSPLWSKVAFYTVWPLAALNAFGWLDDVTRQLAEAKITLDEGDASAGVAAVEISMLDIVRGAIIFFIVFAIAKLLSGMIVRQLDKAPDLSPSLKTILAKVINIATPIIALLVALQMINFNLASLAIIGGAVGLGVGLGLQNIVANFIAGMTLLMDKSIKPGDTIEINDTYGWVTTMGTRYVAIRTRDGDDHLIPNDHFMTNGVINRSHGDKNYRLHASIGVAYGTDDLHLVQKLCVEAAEVVDRVLQHPKPVCHLVQFGDSSIDFDIRFWINDPYNGVVNVRSDVLMGVWERLKAHNIEIPYPQRDLHIKSGLEPLLPEGR